MGRGTDRKFAKFMNKYTDNIFSLIDILELNNGKVFDINIYYLYEDYLKK